MTFDKWLENQEEGVFSCDAHSIARKAWDAATERIENAPIAIMDTRDALGICAPTEEAFPALYALQGHRVRLVVLDDVPNIELCGRLPKE